MKDRKDKRPEADDYHFIKETIKRKPVDKPEIAKKVLAIAAGGILFGVCAAVTIAVVTPIAEAKIGIIPEKRADISLADSEQMTGSMESAAPTALPSKESGTDTKTEIEYPAPLEYYENIYQEVLEVSEEPRKALVRVSGIREDADLLDNSILSSGNEEGIIFLKNDSDFYILTTAKGFEGGEQIQVTFSNGAVATANLCKKDTQTGLAVVRVSSSRLTEQTKKEISVACLSKSYSLLQAKPVIAIGSPTGDYDAVVYGMVTSISEKFTVADAEYNILATDMKGSLDGTGVLLDTSGAVIGFMLHTDADSNIIRAVSIAQLRPLIEVLSNGDSIKYLGIRGMSISKELAETLKVPQGIYVDNVETDSPAMIAGIQSGDIIGSLNGEEVGSMQSYSTRLQKMNAGKRARIVLYRRGADGVYEEMDFSVTVEER